jgi:hypothetical protein
MIYSKFNEPEFERSIDAITTRANAALKDLDHDIDFRHVKIDEHRFDESFITVARSYDESKGTAIITDLTAGHKIISYIMFYAHSYSSHKFRPGHKIVYLYNDNDAPVELPPVDIARLGQKVDGMLIDMDKHATLLTEKEDHDPLPSLAKWLVDGNKTVSKNVYTEPTIYRYKKELRDKGFVEKESDEITMKGHMYLSTR